MSGPIRSLTYSHTGKEIFNSFKISDGEVVYSTIYSLSILLTPVPKYLLYNNYFQPHIAI